MVAGTARERISIDSTTTTFNEEGEDLDFRVESDGNANMLFVDGGNNRVGVGTASPSTALEVSGATTSGGFIPSAISLPSAGTPNIFRRDSDGHLYIQSADVSGTDKGIVLLDGGQNTMINAQPATLTFQTGNAERARINSDGKLLIGSGTSGRTDLLQIHTPASGGGHGILLTRTDSNTDQQIGAIHFGNNNDSDIGQIHVITAGANNTGDMIFSTAITGTTAEKGRLTSEGFFGLGTNDPICKLDANSNASLQAARFHRNTDGTTRTSNIFS